MSTPRKSTGHYTTPSTPRRPCTPESVVGRSPRAPGPPSSPDRRRAPSPDRPTKSYLRPTVSSTLHHGSSNTHHQPRKSIDKPPFLPPSSVGVNSPHHKNPSSSKKGSLTLKGILTRATNAMKSGTGKDRKSSAGAGINFGKGSGNSTPVRPRSPAGLPKRTERNGNLARSNSMPQKITVVNKGRERDTLTISSIEEDNLPEHLPDPVDISSETLLQSTPPQVEPQEPSYTEKIEENAHEGVMENSVVAIEENQKEVKVEEIEETPKEVDNVKVIEECREEQSKAEEEEVKETPKEIEDVAIAEKQEEEEAPKIEAVDVVEELPQGTENVVIVEEQETVTELPNEPKEEVVVANEEEESKGEENKEEIKEPEEKEIAITESNETPKEEVELLQDKVEVEKPVVEPETKVEETPKLEENGIAEATSQVEEKPIAIETEEAPKEEVVAETPKPVDEKPVSTAVSEPKTKKPDAVSTRREGAVSNDVIEETKSKLMEKRKNKVLALVGAFETVMQKPEEGSTRK